jgi:hypothetical protein
MSTTARAIQETGDNSRSSFDPRMLAMLGSVRDELSRRVAAGAPPVSTTLQAVFTDLFGNRPRPEQIRILFFAAPLVRRIVLANADLNSRVRNADITFGEVKAWLWWLDATDPLCARMIDLHYFAGLSIKETAKVLRLPAAAIIRELRFARSWLRIKMPPMAS